VSGSFCARRDLKTAGEVAMMSKLSAAVLGVVLVAVVVLGVKTMV
jgi:hypothetical protein